MHVTFDLPPEHDWRLIDFSKRVAYSWSVGSVRACGPETASAPTAERRRENDGDDDGDDRGASDEQWFHRLNLLRTQAFVLHQCRRRRTAVLPRRVRPWRARLLVAGDQRKQDKRQRKER